MLGRTWCRGEWPDDLGLQRSVVCREESFVSVRQKDYLTKIQDTALNDSCRANSK